MAFLSASNSDGQMVQSFTLGGRISEFAINASTWTEFDPGRCEWAWVEVPITSGRVIHTNSKTKPDLATGAPVAADEKGFVTIYPGTFDFCTDRGDGNRFFFAILDGTDPDETAEIVVMEAGS